MPASATPPSRSRLTPPRLLAAVAFVAVGFVVVWQGFGLVGFGTDLHALRVLAMLFPLVAWGLVVVWPGAQLRVRAPAVIVGLGTAVAAWWYAPSSNFKSAMSLEEAVNQRNWYKERLATPTVEELVRSEGERGIELLFDQYPSLSKGLRADYDRWAERMADDIITGYRKTPLDDFQGFAALDVPTKTLEKANPASAERLDAAQRQWRSNALHAKTHELLKLPLGDWAGFDATASGRRALVDALPDTRETILRAEDEWVDSSVESIVSNNYTSKVGTAPPAREFWKQAHWNVLALKSLATEENRFAKARGRLFKIAHDSAKSEAAAHFDAGHYDRAFGVARTHSVDWSATAAVLGESEEHALAALRAHYAYFDALASKSAKPPEPTEIAPPPRTKP